MRLSTFTSLTDNPAKLLLNLAAPFWRSSMKSHMHLSVKKNATFQDVNDLIRTIAVQQMRGELGRASQRQI